MLAFGGLAQAPLQLRSLNLRGRHFLSGLRIPAFRRRERRLCTVVAEVIVGSDVDNSLKNGVRGKVARDPTVKSIEADLSKIKQDEVSASKTSGRRKRTATKPKASKVDSELDNSTAKAKKKRTATIAPETNKGGERDPVEDQVPGTRKRSTSPARDGTSSRSGKQASENENAVTGTESSTRTRTERKNSSESESLGQLQSSAEDAISIAGAKDDTSRLRSAHACSPNALRLGDGAGQQQEQQAEHQPRPVRAADVDAFSTRNVVAESESTAAQEQEPDGTGAAALGFRALSTKSVEVSELAAFDLRGFGNPSVAKVDQVLTGNWTTEGIVKVDEVVTEAEEGSAIVKVDRVLTDVDETSQARPLYLEIQQRRLEEQERRASPTSKKKKYNIVSEIRFTLDNCSRFGDVIGALEIYNANREAVKFDLYNYNVLLYLCSSAALGVLAPCKQSRQRPDFAESQADAGVEVAEDDAVEEDGVILRGNIAGLSGRNPMGFTQEMMDDFLTKGLEIFEQMQAENVSPNEAALTALARLSVAKRDGDLAFEIVKAMIAAGIPPKLRCYGPAIYVFFKQKNAAKALEVYEHMLAHGVQPEEAELEVLLHLSSVAGLGDRVYSLLHQLRETVRDVSGSTVRVIERWFKSDFAADLGVSSRPGDAMVKRAALERGGGWHGLGWLGRGDWNVEYTTLSGEGICCCCKEKMVTIDITPEDADTFAKCVASLAFKRENNDSFRIFKDWLDKNGPYETVVDGANVGFYNQRFNGELNFAQLNTVVADVHRLSGKWPLVVLHVGRTVKGSGKTPYAQQLLRQWTNANALYVAPTGSNDDWYWLYAAVRCKSLLISNDEMRDHIFQLLGREFFPTWKERHQVRFQVTKQGPMFHMPPPYSIIIQETEKGSWHVPVTGGDDISTPRTWLCVTRRST